MDISEFIWGSRNRFTVLFGILLFGLLASFLVSIASSPSSTPFLLRFALSSLVFGLIGYALSHLFWFFKIERRTYLEEIRSSDFQEFTPAIPFTNWGFRRWQRIRNRGKLHYILVRGIAFFAVYFCLLFSLFNIVWGEYQVQDSVFSLVLGAVIGAVTGLKGWRQLELRYQVTLREKSQEALH